MFEINPSAIFDTLYLGGKLQSKIEDFSMYEVQFFSYFSCLLSLYEGNSLDSWEYNFVRTELGSPYSIDIHNAIKTLTSNGSLSETNEGYFIVTNSGLSFLENYKKAISSVQWRSKYLETATQTMYLLPFGNIKEAINNEPVLVSASYSSSKRNLLLESNPATRALYSQFKALNTALEGQFSELIVPAVVWIEALNRSNNNVVSHDN